MPKPTHTPIRSVRMDDPRWAGLTETAKAAGSNASEVIVCLVDELLEHPDPAARIRELTTEPAAATA